VRIAFVCGSRVEPIALRVAFECDLWVSQLSFVVRVVLWLLPFFCRQLCNGSSSDRIVGSKAERKAERIGFDLIRAENEDSPEEFEENTTEKTNQRIQPRSTCKCKCKSNLFYFNESIRITNATMKIKGPIALTLFLIIASAITKR